MANDWNSYKDAEFAGSQAPMFGGFGPTTSTRNVSVRYFQANVNDEAERAMLEEITNAALRCEGILRKPGDVHIIVEETHFDRDGCYVVALKYLQMNEATPAEEAKQKVGESFNLSDGE